MSALNVEPFIVDIENISSNIQPFLKSKILIINIPLKNMNGFKNLLHYIEKSEIEKLLFVSSTSVYGEENKTIYESSGNELTSHPLFKIENMFKDSGAAVVTIVRFGGLIGNKRHPGRFFVSGRKVKNPDSFVNLIHLDDCIAIIRQIIEKEVWGEVFNCCADTHLTKREYYSKAAESIGVKIPKFENTNLTSFKIISNEKVKHQLNYSFVHADIMDFDYL